MTTKLALLKVLSANSSRSKELIEELCHIFSLDLKDFSEKTGGEFGEDFTAVLTAGPGETFELDELQKFCSEIKEISQALDVKLHVSFLNDIVISSVKNRRVTSAVDPVDQVSFNVPALIRCLEISREQLTSDKQLHMFAEALQAADTTLTTEVVEQAAKAVSNV